MPLDKARFVESFLSAVLGAATYDLAKGRAMGSGQNFDALRKFQSALHLAANQQSFNEETASRYLQRVSSINARNRARYISIVLQPSEKDFEENKTAELIVRHARSSDDDWASLITLFGLESSENINESGFEIVRMVDKLDEVGGKAITKIAGRIADQKDEKKKRFWLARFLPRF